MQQRQGGDGDDDKNEGRRCGKVKKEGKREGVCAAFLRLAHPSFSPPVSVGSPRGEVSEVSRLSRRDSARLLTLCVL